MSIIIQSPRMASGLSGGYLTLRKPQANQILNALEATPALETPASANVANYTIAVAEVGSMGIYSATLTTSQNAALSSGSYAVEGFFGTGTAAVGDKVQWSGSLSIDGSGNESFPLASSAANATNVGMTGTSINATSSGGGGVAKDSIGPATQSVIVPASTAAFTSAFTFTLASAANKLSIEIDNTAGAQDINCQLELNAGNGTQAFMAPGGAISVGAGQKGTLAIGNNAMQALPAAYGGAVYIRSATGTGGTWNIGFNGSAA